MSYAPYRIAQAPEPEAPEVDEERPFAERLRRQTRRTQLTALGGVLVTAGLVIVGLSRPAPSPASRWAEAEREAEQARSAWVHEALVLADAKANKAQLRFEEAIRAAQATEAIEGSCPVPLPQAAGIVRGRSAFPLVVTSREQAAKGFVTSPSVQIVRADIEAAVRHDALGRSEDAALYARALERSDRYRFDVVLVTEKKSDPVVTTATSYEPGEAAGSVFVYDFAQERVVCRGEIQASSSKELGYAYASEPDAPQALERKASLGATLDADLKWQIERAIVNASLHAVR